METRSKVATAVPMRTHRRRCRPIPFAQVVSPVLRPKMLAFHIVCIAGVVAMVNLSLWQFHRLEQRREFNSAVSERSALAAVDIDTIDFDDPARLEWRRIGATGTYSSEDEVRILNRSQGGRAGLNVVTPLRLDDSTSILVVRGFVPLGEEIPMAPSGEVRVLGTARLSDTRRSTDLEVSDGRVEELFRLDIERIDQQVEGDLLPVALYLNISDPKENPSVEPVAEPVLSEGPHLSYAIQWLIFATAVVIGWILATRRTLANSRSLPSA